MRDRQTGPGRGGEKRAECRALLGTWRQEHVVTGVEQPPRLSRSVSVALNQCRHRVCERERQVRRGRASGDENGQETPPCTRRHSNATTQKKKTVTRGGREGEEPKERVGTLQKKSAEGYESSRRQFSGGAVGRCPVPPIHTTRRPNASFRMACSATRRETAWPHAPDDTSRHRDERQTRQDKSPGHIEEENRACRSPRRCHRTPHRRCRRSDLPAWRPRRVRNARCWCR